MSVRLDRLSAWIDSNPYRLYADYRDVISDEDAAMLLAGEFDEFSASIWQWEINAAAPAGYRGGTYARQAVQL